MRSLSAARGRRGAALPVALLGLVAISLLVTTALFTSSTEFAISSAHRNAASSLFEADAALEQYVADRAAAGGATWMAATAAAAPGEVDSPAGKEYLVQVDRLSDTRITNPASGPMTRTEIFSLLVQARDGRGRGVGALVRTIRQANRLVTNINAGATSGGNMSVSGNATISDGRTGTNYCGTQNNTSPYAVQVTAGSTVTLGNNAGRTGVEGAADTAAYGKEELADHVLGEGVTLESLALNAQIKFGPQFGRAEFGNTRPNALASTDSSYNWGCPFDLDNTLTCSAASRARHVVVAIDASRLGTVVINGDYGQGMLIILNGSLRIQGNFTFKGVILVEEDIKVLGGSANAPSKIEGSVIAFGSSSTVEDNYSGTATVKFNRCAITDAENALNSSALDNAPQARAGATYSWYELIR